MHEFIAASQQKITPMNNAFATYLHDHLAGAEFAMGLLQDLGSQDADPVVASVCSDLVTEIEEDQQNLRGLTNRLEESTNSLKESLAAITQKLARAKLDQKNNLGLFESIELLSLGVLGKLALWKTLETLERREIYAFQLNLPRLIRRAESQHSTLEALRRKLCLKTFAAASETTAH